MEGLKSKRDFYIYMAGLFGGEGCVMISHSKKKEIYRLLISMSNNFPGVIKLAKNLFGGSIHNRSIWSTNKGHGWLWRVSSKKAERMILKIHPYAIIKKEEIELALRFRSLKKGSGGRGIKLSGKEINLRKNMYRKMREIKTLRNRKKA